MKKKIYFAAIPPQKTQEEIKSFLQSFHTTPEVKSNPVTVTQANTLFLPLIYLGAMQDEALKAAMDACEMTSVQTQSIQASIQGISYLYSSRQGMGSTIFLDVADSQKRLRDLHKTLSKYLTEADFSPAKHFTPHVPIATLNRVKKEHDRRRILDEISQIEVSGIEPFVIDTLVMLDILYEDLINPRFTIHKEFKLGT